MRTYRQGLEYKWQPRHLVVGDVDMGQTLANYRYELGKAGA